MLLNLSKLTGDDSDNRTYINISTITAVGPVSGDPDSTLILMNDRSTTFVKKPVEEVISILKECSLDLTVKSLLMPL